MIYNGTAVEGYKLLKQSGLRAALVFADPPFGINYKYDIHDDEMNDSDYQSFTDERTSVCRFRTFPAILRSNFKTAQKHSARLNQFAKITDCRQLKQSVSDDCKPGRMVLQSESAPVGVHPLSVRFAISFMFATSRRYRRNHGGCNLPSHKRFCETVWVSRRRERRSLSKLR